MSMGATSGLSVENARAKERTEERRGSDSPETAALGEALWKAMSNGEVPSLSLMAKVTPSTMRRQLRASDPTRLLADLVIVHLARLRRDTALDILEQWLDKAHERVRPALSDARQIDLFPAPRLKGVPR